MALGQPTLMISMRLAVVYVNGIPMSRYERPLEFLVVQVTIANFATQQLPSLPSIFGKITVGCPTHNCGVAATYEAAKCDGKREISKLLMRWPASEISAKSRLAHSP